MDKEQFRAFLFRIATDSAYRIRLETDPVGTYAELGIILSLEDLPEGPIQLPPNAEILESLDRLVEAWWLAGESLNLANFRWWFAHWPRA